MILVCGATGELGGRIVRGLRAAGEPVRALVRPQSEVGDPRRVELARATFATPSRSAGRHGVETVVSTVTVISRALAGEKDADFRRVDVAGHRALIAAAEAAGVARFVFVSAAGVRPRPTAKTPLGRGKIATEDRLAASTLREVVLRPDQFQEVWLSPVAQFDWPKRKVVIFGKGETPVRYVAVDDVAAAAVRLALVDEPPPGRVRRPGRPDAQAGGGGLRARPGRTDPPAHVPRAAMRIGALGLRRSGPRWHPSWAPRSARTFMRRRGTIGRCGTSASSRGPSSRTRDP